MGCIHASADRTGGCRVSRSFVPGGRQHWQPERTKRHHNRRLTDVTAAPLTLHRTEAGHGTLLLIPVPRQPLDPISVITSTFP